MMSVIGWIIFGLIVGIIAKFLMPGRDPGGYIITTLLGIAGALVGGFLGRFLGLYGEGRSGRIHNGSPGIDRITLDLSNGVASRMI